MTLPLQRLLEEGIARAIQGDPSTRFADVRSDSRRVEPRDLFVALRGQRDDGARFVDDAARRGACAVLTDRPIPSPLPVVVCDDARRALAEAAELVHGQPSRAMRVVGITGTNGKTTTSWIVHEALSLAGTEAGLVGTVETRGPGGLREPSSLTTPQADELSRILRRLREGGASHVVMEVSSHALALHRADALVFEVAGFTNLSQDHLDFHGSMEAYFAAKARLFLDLAPRHAVVRVDDAWGARLAREVERRTSCSQLLRVSAAATSGVDVYPRSWRADRSGLRAEVETPWGGLALRSEFVGAHNLDNLLVAIAILGTLGVSTATIEEVLPSVRGAPGRLERIDDPRGVAVFVDYAHTPDALARVLDALRGVTSGRLFVVFGCGGDRDRTKRPAMGRAAAQGADVCVVTSDNPRTESPEEIVRDILAGLEGAPVDSERLGEVSRGYAVEVDRRRAIRLAIGAARSGDTVLIAGKGHETYQIVGHERSAFDDRIEARAAIASVGEAG